jgi:hypothetical protein
MRTWLRRWAAYVLLPLGSVLLLAPLSTDRLEWTERDFVFLGIIESGSGETDSEGPPRLRAEDLARHPALREAVDEMSSRIGRLRWKELPGEPLDGVTPDGWARLVEAHAPDGTFRFGDRTFRGRVSPHTLRVRTPVRHLETARRAVGGGLVILGLLALGGCYATPADSGIRIGRRSAVLIWDAVIVLVGVPFALWFLDMVFAKAFRTAPDWKEDITWGMGFFMVVLANPVLALVTTAVSLQTLRVTRESLVLKGLFGASTVAWDAMDGISVSRSFAPRRIAGVWAPKTVMKVLEISGGGSTLRVLEPPYASTKRSILKALAENAPERWQDRIASVSDEWLARW